MKMQFRSVLFAFVLPAFACSDSAVDTPVAPIVSTTSPVVLPTTETQPVTTTVPVASGTVVDVKVAMPTKFDELLVVGKELVTKGKHGDAKEMFEAAIKLDKKKAEPHIELARLYIELNEKGKAISSANKAVKLAPLSSQAWNTLGRAELNAHRYEDAISSFTKAVELNDANVFAWNNLGYTELLLKRYEDAAEHLMEATSRDGATGYMFNNLGTALEHLDRLDDARLAYEAGGKLGSKPASASRKRLEGVESIAIAKADVAVEDPSGEVRDEVRAEAPGGKVKEYELTDEGDVVDEPVTDTGSQSSEELEAEDATPVEAPVAPKADAPVETPVAPVETPVAPVDGGGQGSSSV